jgi:hypothetical protein
LAKKDALLHFIGVERNSIREKLNRTKPDENRLRNLNHIEAFVKTDDISQLFLAWVAVGCAANSARRAGIEGGRKTGPPKDAKRKKVRNIPMPDARPNDLKNVLNAVKMDNIVYGHVRTVQVTEDNAYKPTEEE